MKKKTKGKGLWAALSVVFVILFAVTMIGGPIANNYSQIINMVLGVESTKTVGGEGAILFETDYADAASQAAAAQELCRTVEANGAVLLLNRDGALPLAAGSKVSLFGNTAVNFIYSGSGSGAMDASKMKDFKQALEQDGKADGE